MRTLIALVAALAVLTLAGCGDDDSGSSGSGDDSTPTTAADDGGCQFLPLDAVAEALGTDVTLEAGGDTGCVFAAVAPSEVRVTVTFTPIAIDPETYAEGTRDVCEGEITEVEAGDIGFACTSFVAPQGFVFIDDASMVVQVDDAVDDETGVAAAAAMLPSVTAP